MSYHLINHEEICCWFARVCSGWLAGREMNSGWLAGRKPRMERKQKDFRKVGRLVIIFLDVQACVFKEMIYFILTIMLSTIAAKNAGKIILNNFQLK